MGKEVKNAVVTVPAYFTDTQKKATTEACKIAGLNEPKILTEPTAAAIAYCIDKANQGDKKCLVFDFGGGTLDITILGVASRQISVKCCCGDSSLGGVDVDRFMMQHVLADIYDN